MNSISYFLRRAWDWFVSLFVLSSLSEPHQQLTEGSSEALREKDPFLVVAADLDTGTKIPPTYWENAALLAENLSILAAHLKKPVIIVDGFRSEEDNIGKNPRSTHLNGTGADIKVKGVSKGTLAKTIKFLIKEGEMHKGGVAVYPDHVHYDVRGKNVSWQGKRKK